MNTYQHKTLSEWIAAGKQAGRIRNVRTVVLAYCMDEREALACIADIATGKTAERDALVFMERVIQYDERAHQPPVPPKIGVLPTENFA
jgi:hypothetical protein